MMRRAARLALLLAALPAAAGAQGVPSVAPGWGVDTTAVAWSDGGTAGDVAAVFRLWRDYLLDQPQLLQQTARWSAAEQREWPAFDLTAGIAYQGMPATVLDIVRDPAAGDGGYTIRTLFTAVADDGRTVRPIAITRVHAVRENGQWVLAGALPRATRDWRREQVGAITYIVDPGRGFDRARAERAVAFADSLADAFGLPRIEDVSYYVAATPDAMLRAMGVEWTVPGQGHGYAIPWNRMILSGDVEFGEENRHELVHYVLAPILEQRRTHRLVNEGVATWYGGSVGRDYARIVAEYGAYVRARPDLTLDAILAATGPDPGVAPAGAVLVALVHEAAGMAGVRELLTAGRTDDELRAALGRLLGTDWAGVEARWRGRLAGAAGS